MAAVDPYYITLVNAPLTASELSDSTLIQAIVKANADAVVANQAAEDRKVVEDAEAAKLGLTPPQLNALLAIQRSNRDAKLTEISNQQTLLKAIARTKQNRGL